MTWQQRKKELKTGTVNLARIMSVFRTLYGFSNKNDEFSPMQKKMKYIILMVISVLCIAGNISHAQTGDAGQPGEFLRYGVGGRALGMGHAFTGLADDASSVYWNPAGLMNVPRKEFTSMYTNLFLDSRYTYMAVALPRTFVGPHNAIGFGWVNLNMADFEQRNYQNIHIGDFDFYEQAFIISGAREFIGTWGILNYGLNLKLVNQAFPGVSGYSSTNGWGFGADVGVTFRPINAPLFKFVPLRWIMPLQLGFALQNVLPPSIGIGDGVKDKYPQVIRWGASYRLAMADWRLTLVLDQEIFITKQDITDTEQKVIGRYRRSSGWFTGFEAETPQPFAGTQPSLRAGWNSRAGAPTLGGGVKLNYINNAAIRIDFAYAIKPNDALNNDFRLFLTVDFGQSYDTSFYAARVEEEDTERGKMAEHLHILTFYQQDYEISRKSALELAVVYDEKNQDRYIGFIGGAEAVVWYYEQIQTLMVKYGGDPNIIERLQKFADKIITLMEQ
jgi:hypothetical protein